MVGPNLAVGGFSVDFPRRRTVIREAYHDHDGLP